ncbi:MAG: glutamine--fructose-6-phosphate transaminase (isomerizing) [Bacteroidetes bacterium]|nr:glutamine--fructose-6-phosphate transaminase (isomerizing) [Bacteroidota bacterium]
MCGIVGYIGKKEAKPILIKGLKRLEYRGYDSAGLALLNHGKIDYFKGVGKIHLLEKDICKQNLQGTTGIAHTRWSTHGEPNQLNAHPQFDCSKKIAIVHNGIIENYSSLKKWLLKRGHSFISQTDTEVIAHLIEENYHGSFINAIRKTLSLLEGTFSLAIITTLEPDKIFVTRRGGPLIIGCCKNNEYLVASDPTVLIEHTKKVVYLEDNEIAILKIGKLEVLNLKKQIIKKEIKKIKYNLQQIEKGGFPHFMLKEIFEQPISLKNTIAGRAKNYQINLGGIKNHLQFLSKAPRIVITACGTSWHAALIAEYLLENLAGISTEVEYASEFRYKKTPIDKKTAYFVISQSGETADTLESIKKIKSGKGRVFGIVNTVGSSIARETGAGIYLHAGPEIGVASTKAFTSQLTIFLMLALLLAKINKKIKKSELIKKIESINKIPELIKETLKLNNYIKKIAQKYKKFNNFLYLGRGYNFPIALEGALKLKEISYIHAEGYPAAEMKHGPIALIDKKMPVIVIATDTEDIIYQKVLSNIEEIKARQGNLIIIASQGNKEIKKMANEIIYIPKSPDFISPLLNVIPLQLLAYHLAVLRGCDVDQPRNLAKSVTVE